MINSFLKKGVTLLMPTAAAAAKSLQSCLTLCDPIDGSPPGSPIPGILQARVLEWGAIAFSVTHASYLYIIWWETEMAGSFCFLFPIELELLGVLKYQTDLFCLSESVMFTPNVM